MARGESPIFVVGMPRSGTTLMSAMLASHPSISIAPETHFLTYWMRRFRGLDVRKEKDFRRFWESFGHGPQVADLRLDTDVLRDRLLRSGEHDYRDIFSALLRTYAHKTRKARWGEKTPTHYLHLDTLLRWFPRARILYLVRDPRAVVASRLGMPWRKRNAEDVASQWRGSIRILDAWGHDGRVHEVRYEALVRDPVFTLRHICDFLEGAYEPSMLEYADAALGLIAEKPWNENAHLPLDPSRIDRWKGEISPHDVAVIEHLTRREMRDHGYEPNGDPLRLLHILPLGVRRLIRASRRRLLARETDSYGT